MREAKLSVNHSKTKPPKAPRDYVTQATTEMILDLVVEVNDLRQKNIEKEKRIAIQGNRVVDLEQYMRMNDIILFGMEIKPGLMNSKGITEQDSVSMEQQVIATFLQSKGIEVDNNSIEACHPLSRKNTTDKLAIILLHEQKAQKCATKTRKRVEGVRHLSQ